jgi:hypothetical protein
MKKPATRCRLAPDSKLILDLGPHFYTSSSYGDGTTKRLCTFPCPARPGLQRLRRLRRRFGPKPAAKTAPQPSSLGKRAAAAAQTHNAPGQVVGVYSPTSCPAPARAAGERRGFELVQKLLRCGDRAAVGLNGLAVRAARVLTLTVLGFVRQGRYSINTIHGWRLTGAELSAAKFCSAIIPATTAGFTLHWGSAAKPWKLHVEDDTLRLQPAPINSCTGRV